MVGWQVGGSLLAFSKAPEKGQLCKK